MQEEVILGIRKECRQFAMLYYHACKTLAEAHGQEKALDLAREMVFSLSCDRAERLRAHALAQGIPLTPEGFSMVNDLPAEGWTDACGGLVCPYAETWLEYIREEPWFQAFASQYCDVIDTTNIEVFSGDTSHRITKSLLWGDAGCEREYFPSEEVKAGRFTYGKRTRA